VALPFVCRVFVGKMLGTDETSGTVLRLGRRHVDVRLDGTLPLLTHLRVRINAPPRAAWERCFTHGRIEPRGGRESLLLVGCGKPLDHYGRETVVESPVAEMLNVPAAVEPVYAYGELQPTGGGGTFAMNGPAVWPRVFVTTPVN
jgi:hypothetical protein